MKQLKDKYEILKELWSVPRYKSLIKLGLYILFFIFVIALIKTNYKIGANLDETLPSNVENIKAENYFESTITTLGKTYIHTKDKDIELLVIDGVYYSVNYNVLKPYNFDEKVEIDGEAPEFIVKFWRFTPQVIKTLLEKAVQEFETKYSDGSIETGYKIPMRKVFENINSGLSLREGKNIDEETFTFKIKKTGTKINTVTLDVTNYKNLFVEDTNKEEIIIEYK